MNDESHELTWRGVLFAMLAVACAGTRAHRTAIEPTRYREGIASAAPPSERDLWVGSYRVVLNATTLYDIAAQFRTSTIVHTKSGGEWTYTLCFRTSGDSPLRIVLESGDLGGDELDVLAYSLSYATADSASTNCPMISVGAGDVRVGTDLRLGMTWDAVQRRIEEKDIRLFDDEIIAVTTDTRAHSAAEPARYLDAGMRARFSHDRLISLYVWKTVTT